MNILTDKLPESVSINGVEYGINTDFRAGIKFELMIQKGEEDVLKLLSPFFNKNIPEDLNGTLKAIELFYCCGKLPDENKKEKPTSKNQSYCFDYDANIIFADFLNFYKIDLNVAQLHWWTFRSLLEGLPEKSEFKQRIYYRTCETKKLSKGEKERILKYRSLIAIEQKKGSKMTLEQRNKQMKEYILNRIKKTQGGGMNG